MEPKVKDNGTKGLSQWNLRFKKTEPKVKNNGTKG